jgi:hypothetical protein
MFWFKYDNAVCDMFYVETPKGMLPFVQLKKFLYVFKPPELENLKTIKHLAVRLMQIWKRFWGWMESKIVVQDDIVLAEKIYGKDIVQDKPVVHDIVHVPSELKIGTTSVSLWIDTFFVNKMPLLHTFLKAYTSELPSGFQIKNWRFTENNWLLFGESTGIHLSKFHLYVQTSSLNHCWWAWKINMGLKQILLQCKNMFLWWNAVSES